MKILCFGDIFGPAGVDHFLMHLPAFREQYQPDVIIVNAENSGPGGRGPSPQSLEKLLAAGIDVLTGGNHSFDRRETYAFYQEHKNCLRPHNFPPGTPGYGYGIFPTKTGAFIGVISIQLRTFMREQLGCPFRAVESLLPFVQSKTQHLVIDMHGEATAEKLCFGAYFDGQASVIFGTHTHVQTADERILPKGTAYLTDVGTTGAFNSSLGLRFEGPMHNFLTQLGARFEPEETGPFCIGGLFVHTEDETGKALHVERILKINERTLS